MGDWNIYYCSNCLNRTSFPQMLGVDDSARKRHGECPRCFNYRLRYGTNRPITFKECFKERIS